ncbi:MAG: haloacid dehalogenase type II [Chloroflexi bacterium]|nr:haloacid dehalogenase type II [Chloroflexota bacterium]
MPRTIVFDVNETLLDLGALAVPFAEVFGDASARGLWFAQVLQTAMTSNAIGRYSNFGVIGGAALEMVAERRGVTLSDHNRANILGTIREMPAHPEVPSALERLKTAGYRLATLTNSPPAAVDAQLAFAGIADMFEMSLSVDAVSKFKPHRAAYDMAARRLDVAPAELMLVAAHNWDTSGAIAAGWQAAFVARPGMVLGPLDATPQIVGADMTDVVKQILHE